MPAMRPGHHGAHQIKADAVDVSSHPATLGCRCWSLLKTGMSPEDILMEEEAMLQGMRSDFQVPIPHPKQP